MRNTTLYILNTSRPPRCSRVRVIGLLGISGYLSGRSWPTLRRLWKWMLVFMLMMIAGPAAFMSSCLSPLMRMKGLVTVLDVVTATQAHQTEHLSRLFYLNISRILRGDISVLMIPYNDVPQKKARRHLDEDVVDPFPGLSRLLPVLQPGLLAGGLDDLLVALPQLLDVLALSLQSKVRHVLSKVQMVHGGSLFINRYLGRDGSKTRKLSS